MPPPPPQIFSKPSKIPATVSRQAQEMLTQMRAAGLQPGFQIYSAVISLYNASQLSPQTIEPLMTELQLDPGVCNVKHCLDTRMHGYAADYMRQLVDSQRGRSPHLTHIFSVLLAWYAAQHDLERAELVLRLITEVPRAPFPISPEAYNRLACAYCAADDLDKAQKLLTDMQEANVAPAPETQRAVAGLLLRRRLFDAAEVRLGEAGNDEAMVQLFIDAYTEDEAAEERCACRTQLHVHGASSHHLGAQKPCQNRTGKLRPRDVLARLTTIGGGGEPSSYGPPPPPTQGNTPPPGPPPPTLEPPLYLGGK